MAGRDGRTERKEGKVERAEGELSDRAAPQKKWNATPFLWNARINTRPVPGWCSQGARPVCLAVRWDGEPGVAWACVRRERERAIEAQRRRRRNKKEERWATARLLFLRGRARVWRGGGRVRACVWIWVRTFRTSVGCALLPPPSTKRKVKGRRDVAFTSSFARLEKERKTGARWASAPPGGGPALSHHHTRTRHTHAHGRPGGRLPGRRGE